MKKVRGQVALVVMIVSAVVMTIGLSVSRRTVVETKITNDEELLKQAFNAAESGLDYYLGTGSTSYAAIDQLSLANVSVRGVDEGAEVVNTGVITLRNSQSLTWLVGHNIDTGAIDFTKMFSGTSLLICTSNAFDGSLKVDYFYRDSGNNYRVFRAGYNVGTVDRVTGFENIAASPVTACPGVAGMRGITLSLPANPGGIPLLLAVKPIGADTFLATVGVGGSFPVQGKELVSVGSAGNLTSNAQKITRKIRVIHQFHVPAFMLDALTASGNVLSN